MAIFQKDLEKIESLNQAYDKTLRAELLQFLDLNKDDDYQGLDVDFELKNNLLGQYNKSISYLNLLNNNHISFFENTIKNLSDKSKRISNGTEKLLFEITNEFNLLKERKDLNSSLSYISLADKIYKENDFNETSDFLNGHFLFNKKLLKPIYQNSIDEIVKNDLFKDFHLLFSFFSNLKDKFINERYNLLSGFNLNQNELGIFKKILNTQQVTNDMSVNNIESKINLFFKTYLCHNVNLNNQLKITNNKKYPISTSGLSQSVYNLIESQNYYSNNALFYGIIPISTRNISRDKFDKTLITDVAFFQKDISNEFLPLKFINRSDISIFDDKVQFQNLIKNIENELYANVNSDNNILLNTFEKNDIEKLNPSAYTSLFIDNNFFNLNKYINPDDKVVGELGNISINSSLLNKDIKALLDNDIIQNKHTKFNIFKNKFSNLFVTTASSVDNPSLINFENKDSINPYIHITDDESLTFNDTQIFYDEVIIKNQAKKVGLNLLSMIASKINTDNLTILSTRRYLSQSKSPIFDEPLIVDPDNLIQGNNELLNGINEISTTRRGKGALPFNVNTGLAVSTNTTKTGDLKNINDIINSTNASSVNVSYAKKSKIFQESKGLSNFSFFKENTNFAMSITKNRFLINDIVKKAKKILKPNALLNLKKINQRSKEIIENKNPIHYDSNSSRTKMNMFNKIFEKNLIDSNNRNKNLYKDCLTVEDSLGFLNNSDYQLNDKIILKGDNIITNDSLLNIVNTNITNFINQNVLNVDNQLNESQFQNLYTTENNDILENIKSNHSNDLKHFINTSSLFEYLKEYCKEYIDRNLTDDDHLNNFSKRANIVETAVLLWSISKNSIEISQKFNLKNDLVDILLFELIAKNNPNIRNSNEDINNIKNNIISNVSPDLISDIAGFYVWSDKLKNINIDNISQYNPYNNSDHFEQEGLFYHFLFSNLHQKSYFKIKNETIEKYSNFFNPHEYLKTIFSFYTSSKNTNRNYIYTKNLLNSGYFDFFGENDDYINLFLPYIEYSFYENKPCFIISLKTFDIDKLNLLKSTVKSKLTDIAFNMRNNLSFDKYFNDIDDLINNIDDVIKEKNILNIAKIENSFLNSNDSNSFLQSLINDMLDFPEIKNKLNGITSFSQLKNSTDENILSIKNIIESTLISCSDIFNKMFIELQSYNALSSRIFESNFYFQHNKELLKLYPTGGNNTFSVNEKLNKKNVIKYILNDEYKQILGVDNLEKIKNYYTQYVDNNLNKKFKNSENDIVINHNTLKPSEKKFISTLKNILGMSKDDILKIYTYMSSRPELISKNVNIFEYFNLHSVPIQKVVRFKKEDSGAFNFGYDCSTFTYDYLHEIDCLSNFKTYVNIPYNDQYPSNNDLNDLNDLNYLENVSAIESRIDMSTYIYDRDNLNDLETLQFNSLISLKDIFNYIIVPSYNLRDDYHNIEVYNINNQTISQKSGCKNLSEENINHLLDINDFNVLKPTNNDIMTFKDILVKNYSSISNIKFENIFDINSNWYNHVYRGLILNDFIELFNMELISYYNSYEKGIGKDTYDIYQYLNNIRNSNTNYSSDSNLFTYNSKDYLKQNTTLKNFVLSKNNTLLKKSYFQNVFNSKKSKNLIDIFNKNNKNIPIAMNYLMTNNDFILSSFKDFYLTKFVGEQEKIYGKTINSPNNSKYLLLNQSNDFKKSHLLTIGIEENNNFKNDSMFIVTVEMIDHDFPLIKWESKQFEFDMSLDDSINEIFQKNNLFSSIGDPSIANVVEQLPLISYEKIENENNNIVKLVNQQASPQDLYTNNINLKQSSLNELGLNISLDYQKLLQNRKNSYIKKFDKIRSLNEIDNNIFQNTIVEGMVRRSIYNQKRSTHLKHIIKLMTGNEFNLEFSLNENKQLQDILVLNEVYDLYTTSIFSNLNSSIENELGFTFEELEQAFSISGDINFDKNIEIGGLSFKVGNITDNQKLNVFIKFMSDFTRAIVPANDVMSNKNFKKIVNISVNPADFVVSSISLRSTIFTNQPQDYSFISFFEIDKDIIDELYLPYKSLNGLILSKNDIGIQYFEVKYNDEKYIPKNVSYRIKVDLLD